MLTTRSLTKGLPWLLALLLLASTALTASCTVADRVQEFRGQRQVPREMSTLWEVYQTVKADYAGKEPVDQRALVDGAVQGMLRVLAVSDTSVVPEDRYDADAPNLGGVWQAWRIISDYARDNGSKITQEQLQQGAIRGMLHALGNPYTNYLDQDLYTLEEQNL
ncbi:MAG: hypothetical protein HY681_06575, partial [Chloroflexi bacterium]|nr:hypothetical protein [Chloroflexota bacterium]